MSKYCRPLSSSSFNWQFCCSKNCVIVCIIVYVPIKGKYETNLCVSRHFALYLQYVTFSENFCTPQNLQISVSLWKYQYVTCNYCIKLFNVVQILQTSHLKYVKFNLDPDLPFSQKQPPSWSMKKKKCLTEKTCTIPRINAI